MSFEALLWATNDAPIADVNEFAVLTMLAEKADPDGCNAFPSRPTMASRTHIDPKTVLRTLQRLEARGLIAKGDQSAASYLRADRRPVVYDLLIPYSWFPNITRINKERQDRGRPPLTRAERPDIAPAPTKARRSDLGKKREKKGSDSRGDSETPRDGGDQEGHGVTVSSERGDSESGTGGLRDTRTSPLTQSFDPGSCLLSQPKADVRTTRAGERPSAGADNEPTLSRETVQILADPSVQALVVQHLSPAQLAMTDRLIARELAVLGRDGVERVSWRLQQGLAGEGAGSIREPFGWLQTYMRRLGCARSCVCKRPDCERGVIWGDGMPCRDCQREAEDRMAAAGAAGAPEPEAPPVPEQRPAGPALVMQNCDECDRGFRAAEPGLCRDCATQPQPA